MSDSKTIKTKAEATEFLRQEQLKLGRGEGRFEILIGDGGVPYFKGGDVVTIMTEFTNSRLTSLEIDNKQLKEDNQMHEECRFHQRNQIKELKSNISQLKEDLKESSKELDESEWETAFEKAEHKKTKQSQWIDVNEELPTNQEIILLKTSLNYFITGHYLDKNSGFIMYGTGVYDKIGEVTHWQPITE